MDDEFFLEIEAWTPSHGASSGGLRAKLPPADPVQTPLSSRTAAEPDILNLDRHDPADWIQGSEEDPFVSELANEDFILRSISEVGENSPSPASTQTSATEHSEAVSISTEMEILVGGIFIALALLVWLFLPRARQPRALQSSTTQTVQQALDLLAGLDLPRPPIDAPLDISSLGRVCASSLQPLQQCHDDLQALSQLGDQPREAAGAINALQLALVLGTAEMDVSTPCEDMPAAFPRSLAGPPDKGATRRGSDHRMLASGHTPPDAHSDQHAIAAVSNKHQALASRQAAVGLVHGIAASLQRQELLARQTSEDAQQHHKHMQESAERAAAAAAATLVADHLAAAAAADSQLSAAAQSLSVMSMLGVLVLGGLVSPLLAPCTCLPHFVSAGGGMGGFRWPAKLLLAGMGLPYECGPHTFQLQPSCLVLALGGVFMFAVASTVLPGPLLRWGAYAGAIAMMVGPTAAAIRDRWAFLALAGALPFAFTLVVQLAAPYIVPSVPNVLQAQRHHNDPGALSVQLRGQEVRATRWWALIPTALCVACTTAVLAATMACSADAGGSMHHARGPGGVGLLASAEVHACLGDYVEAIQLLMRGLL